MSTAFSRPHLNKTAQDYVRTALESGQWGGDGPFTGRCHALLGKQLGSPALLMYSCTAALEMSALLVNVGPEDEIVMPSYTFVSTANAFVLRGAVPVFVDIRPDTLNLDERLIEQALTPRTKAIVPVHYAGVACEMDAILAVAGAHGLAVIEDAAQGIGAAWRGRPLGTMGALGCLSFHVTKNIVSGEGGALIVNDASLLERAHILREKGTDRTAFLNREVDKYRWLDVGSSFLPSDILAAVLLSQLEICDALTAERLKVWHRYHAAFADAEESGRLCRPTVPPHARINGHSYHLLFNTPDQAGLFRDALAQAGIPAPGHYIPLHSAPAGLRFGRTATGMDVTDKTAATLVRLPLHAEMPDAECDRIISFAHDILNRI